MNVAPLEFDLPRAISPRGDTNAFTAALGEAARSLEQADAAETAFAQHRGGLQESVIARTKADIMLQIATAASSRSTQALAALLNMQV